MALRTRTADDRAVLETVAEVVGIATAAVIAVETADMCIAMAADWLLLPTDSWMAGLAEVLDILRRSLDYSRTSCSSYVRVRVMLDMSLLSKIFVCLNDCVAALVKGDVTFKEATRDMPSHPGLSLLTAAHISHLQHLY